MDVLDLTLVEEELRDAVVDAQTASEYGAALYLRAKNEQAWAVKIPLVAHMAKVTARFTRHDIHVEIASSE